MLGTTWPHDLGTDAGRPQADLDSLPLNQLLDLWTQLVFMLSIRPVLEYVDRAQLSISESIVLRLLDRRPLNVAEVASCISISQSAASRAIDRLVHDGYVERHENPEDRRQKHLSLTPLGRALVDRMNSATGDAAGPLVAVLDTADREQFRRLLAKMIAGQQGCPMEHDALAPDDSSRA